MIQSLRDLLEGVRGRLDLTKEQASDPESHNEKTFDFLCTDM